MTRMCERTGHIDRTRCAHAFRFQDAFWITRVRAAAIGNGRPMLGIEARGPVDNRDMLFFGVLADINFRISGIFAKGHEGIAV